MYDSEFGSYFRSLRLNKKLTRKELSELTGFSITKIADIERARLKPKIEMVSAMKNTNLFNKEEITQLQKYISKTENESENNCCETNMDTEYVSNDTENEPMVSEKENANTLTDIVNDETIKIALETYPYLNDLIITAYACGLTKKQCKKITKKMIKKYG